MSHKSNDKPANKHNMDIFVSNQSSSLIILIKKILCSHSFMSGKKTVVVLPREPINDFNLLVGILGFDRDLKN